MINLKETWEFWALTAGIFAALTAIFIKAGIGSVNSDYALLIRTLIILPLLVIFLLSTNQWNIRGTWTSRNWVFLTLSAIATTASWIAYFRALKIGSVSQVVPVEKISIVLVALFGVFFLKENLSVLNWLGIFLVAIGSIFIGR